MKYFVYSLNRNDMETEPRSIPFVSYLRAVRVEKITQNYFYLAKTTHWNCDRIEREREPTLDEAMRYSSLSVINIVKQQVCSVTDIT